jgi:hypothetical protein
VVQQWLITGWGSMAEWFPWLPELPEHRRLGYHPPRDINDVIVVSGEGAPQRKGVQGWLQKRMEEAQKNAEARRTELKKGGAAAPATATASTAETSADGDTASAKPGRKSTSYQSRVTAASKFGSKNGQASGSADGATDKRSTTARGTSSPTVNRPRPKKKKRAS